MPEPSETAQLMSSVSRMVEPAAQVFPEILGANPLSQVHPFVPAEPFFRRYVEERYGRSSGFRVLAVAP